MRHKLTRAERQRGGRTTAAIAQPRTCPRCKKRFTTHPAYAGHLGLHTLADRYTGGDIKKAKQLLVKMGHAALDQIPGNGAFAPAHQALAQVRAQKRTREEEAAIAAQGRAAMHRLNTANTTGKTPGQAPARR